MRRTIQIISFVVLTCFLSDAIASKKASRSKAEYSKGFFVSGQASTNGWGFDLRYMFSEALTIKSGFETLDLNYGFDFAESSIEYDAKLNYKTGGIFLMADINYTRNLYISAGVAQNTLSPKIEGIAVSELEYGDITIPPSEVGDFTVTLTPSAKISPYIGAGVRSFLGQKERFTFHFETGMYYLGPPNAEIDANGLLAPTADPVHGQKELIESQFSQYQFYPVVKLNVAVKLF